MDKDLLSLVRFDPKQLTAAIKKCVDIAENYEAEKQKVLLLAEAYRQLLRLHGFLESEAATADNLHLNSDPHSLADAAVSVLQKAGKKLHGRKILAELQAQGFCKDGKYPMGTLAVALRRDGRIEKDKQKRNTWKLAAQN